jgi:hypothetical protein
MGQVISATCGLAIRVLLALSLSHGTGQRKDEGLDAKNATLKAVLQVASHVKALGRLHCGHQNIYEPL